MEKKLRILENEIKSHENIFDDDNKKCGKFSLVAFKINFFPYSLKLPIILVLCASKKNFWEGIFFGMFVKAI